MISEKLDNGENQSLDDLLNFMDTKLGALHQVSLINIPPTFSSQVGTIIGHCLSSKTFQWCQTLRSWPTLHQHYMESFNYFYSSSFWIIFEGHILLLPKKTSLPHKMVSCVTRLTRLHYSQTTTTNSLEIGWQILLILIYIRKRLDYFGTFLTARFQSGVLYKNLGVVLLVV